jgi:hypothetical protein
LKLREAEDDFGAILETRIKSKRGLTDAQRFILRNIWLSSIVIFSSLFLDPLRTILFSFGLNATDTPWSFGLLQGLSLAIAGTFLTVSLIDWRYYK